MNVSDKSPLEKHITTIFVAIVCSVISFSATYLFNDKSEKAVLSSQLSTIHTQVTELRAEIKTMRADFATKDVVHDHENRIRSLERKIK